MSALTIDQVAHLHDVGYVENQLRHVAAGLQDAVLAEYQEQLNECGRAVANRGLLHIPAVKHEDDAALKSRGYEKAKRCEDIYRIRGYEALVSFVKHEGVSLPAVPASTMRVDNQCPVEAGITSRLVNPKWWARQLRKQQDRNQEQQAIDLGLVGFGKQVYCSDASLVQVLARRSINREHMESLDAVNLDTGEVMPMANVINAGVANPENLRNETMQKIADAETFYKERGYKALFLTLTLPSKYHRMKKVGGVWRKNAEGKKQRLGGKAVKNPKYQPRVEWAKGRGEHIETTLRDNSPRLGQARLCLNWSRARAALNDACVAYEWLRVAEPHQDGTPHWHMLVFVKAEQVEAFSRIIWNVWLREDGEEAGALSKRVEIKPINPKKGSAASYVAKYIAKNINGAKVGEDFESGLAASDSVLRVQAWRSTWGIRGFQFSQGLGSIGVWRELRRINEGEALEGAVKQAFLAADDGDYYSYLKLQTELSQQGEALKPIKQIKPVANVYGELLTVIVGIQHADNESLGNVCDQLITRPYNWELVQCGDDQDKEVPYPELSAREEVENILGRSASPLGILENNCRKVLAPDFETEGKHFQEQIIKSLWHENAYCHEVKGRPKEKHLTFVDFFNEITKVSDSGLKIEEAQRLQLLAMRDTGCLEVMV